MNEKNLHALAAELDNRLPKHPEMPEMDVAVSVDEDGEYINCAPLVDLFGRQWGTIMYVDEIVLFAQYHDLSVRTHLYETGAGLRLG